MTNIPASSFRIFADKLIDYAGLFPPAKLDLKTAFLNYLTYLNSPFNWMVSRFVIPVERLDELNNLIKSESVKVKNQISFSVLGRSNVATSKFLSYMSDDIKQISDFKKKFGDKAVTDVFEVPLPLELMVMPKVSRLLEFFKAIFDSFESGLKSSTRIFLETKPDKNLPVLAQAIAAYNLNNSAEGRLIGLKLRTGGVEASAFPHPDQIAFAIKTCSDSGIPMKCTAGLHHPLRHYDESVKTRMHGFVNVFGSGILSYTLDINQPLIFDVLMDENPSNFSFTEDGLVWENLKVFNEEIQEAREKLMISFGSCSLDEPINDLKVWKLL
jgi:hypothetical protein